MATQLAPRGINDPRVLAAMRKVPRERFVPKHEVELAYEDRALSISYGQTISQPYMVALMLQSLRLNGFERVLEIGTGSGYQTALLAELAREVYTIERLGDLLEGAKALLAEMQYKNVHFRHGDGSVGWPEMSPYGAILVAAAAPAIPRRLTEQLRMGGRLVVPMGDLIQQELILVTREEARMSFEALCPCSFVPLLGEDAWQKRKE